MKHFSTFSIVITSLFAALICVATMLIQVPIPATGGYANLGDAVILICAFLMPMPNAVLAAGLGSMLADILAGYASFAPGTLVIKAGVALIAFLLFRALGREKNFHRQLFAMLCAGILAEVFMILGYFFYEGVLMGVGLAAAGGIIGNIGQGIVGTAIACLIAPALTRSREITEMMDKIKRK